MHTRFVIALSALTLFGLGCHGSDYRPPATAARSVTPPAYPQETTSVSRSMATPGEGRATESTKSTSTPSNAPANVPPPSAGVSSPTQSSEPFKPGSDGPPGIGGGPNPSTGGAVFGDGNEGNTGAVKGGDGTQPGK